jgi:hypothetical protein
MVIGCLLPFASRSGADTLLGKHWIGYSYIDQLVPHPIRENTTLITQSYSQHLQNRKNVIIELTSAIYDIVEALAST